MKLPRLTDLIQYSKNPYVAIPKISTIRGFSLIEILVAVGIISLIAAAAIPNIRKFSSDQDIQKTKADIKNSLEKALSSARSGVKCSGNRGSVSWTVNFNQNKYSISALCTDQQKDAEALTNLPAGISLTTSCNDASATGNQSVIFNGDKISYLCQNNAVITGEFIITLNKKGTSPGVIKINDSGVIYE